MTVRIEFETEGDADAWIDVNSELFGVIVSHAMENNQTVTDAAADVLGATENIVAVDN